MRSWALAVFGATAVAAGVAWAVIPPRLYSQILRDGAAARDAGGYRINFLRLWLWVSERPFRRIAWGFTLAFSGMFWVWASIGRPSGAARTIAADVSGLLGLIVIIAIWRWVAAELRRTRGAGP